MGRRAAVKAESEGLFPWRLMGDVAENGVRAKKAVGRAAVIVVGIQNRAE